jgi:hypothetical protein
MMNGRVLEAVLENRTKVVQRRPIVLEAFGRIRESPPPWRHSPTSRRAAFRRGSRP